MMSLLFLCAVVLVIVSSDAYIIAAATGNTVMFVVLTSQTSGSRTVSYNG